MESPLERWPGYDEQSWSERFAELDRRYDELLAKVPAIVASLKPADAIEALSPLWVGESPTIDELRAIVAGIDATGYESDEGWWDTSTGAEFGRGVLAKLEALFSRTVEVGEDEVERAAEALWQEESLRAGGRMRKIAWADEHPEQRKRCIGLARAALTSARAQ